MEVSELRRSVAQRQWYHTIELRPDVVTPGWFDTRTVPARLPFPSDLTGRRCLDVGTFDGFWAFEMERRGASEVVAVDVPDPEDWDWPPGAPRDVRERISERHEGGEGFELAHRALGSEVRKERCSIYDLDPEHLGTFDFVYVGSLLVHLRDPVGALDRVRRVCRGRALFVDTIDWWMTVRWPRRPMARLDGRDRPWWWNPNEAALVRMVEAAGFELVQPSSRLRIPAGRGQPDVAIRPATIASRAGREAIFRRRIGDHHAAVLARPGA